MRPEKRRLIKIDDFAFGQDQTFLREVIRSHPLFKELSEEDMELLIQKSAIVELRKDEFIIRRGEFPDSVYLLLDGVVRKEMSPENSMLLYLGSTCGVHFVLNQKKPFDCDFKTESDCRLMKIGLDLIARFMSKYSNFVKVVCSFYLRHYIFSQRHNKHAYDVSSPERQPLPGVQGQRAARDAQGRGQGPHLDLLSGHRQGHPHLRQRGGREGL